MIEGSARAPHVRKYTLHGQTAVIEVDGRGVVQVSEELMHEMLWRLGYVETTNS